MNQLQALAMNDRWKKKRLSEQGRAQLEKLSLAPWASRRRQELHIADVQTTIHFRLNQRSDIVTGELLK
jgi:hypothetical protein